MGLILRDRDSWVYETACGETWQITAQKHVRIPCPRVVSCGEAVDVRATRSGTFYQPFYQRFMDEPADNRVLVEWIHRDIERLYGREAT